MYFLLIYLFYRFLIKWYSSSTNLEVDLLILDMYFCFSDLEDFWDDLPISRLEVIWTSWKSSDKVVWTSRKSSGFSERFGKFLCLIFLHLVTSCCIKFLIIWYSSSTNLKVDLLFLDMYFCVFCKGFSDLEDFWDDLLVSRLKVVWKSSGSRMDFLKVVWTSCKVVWKSSELPKSLLAKSSELPGSRLDFLKVVWSCLLKWNPSLSL
ncbi:hypothetical protein IGI04_011806 [Brassica rapa subsp. trilocularis]|uniref:Reverse transcriptase zinc-binding domain-containing protein n=1 Tax=Brassica rapa subsp. trilocularis TaxID=1813537 RepID=A0ABQ7N450_BRACM|nr:hypothetical protein IGI04_011806 [Brassica rapa subsp. trilocularis]